MSACWMNRIADRMEPYLRASGINVTRNDPEGTVGTSIRASNAGNYDFHLALHSNAAPPQSAGTVRGIDLYYYPGSTDGLRMANILADNLREIYPLPAERAAAGLDVHHGDPPRACPVRAGGAGLSRQPRRCRMDRK